MLWLKQSTSVVISFGPFVDKTDGVTPETGLVTSLDHASTGIMLSKNGGALAVRNPTVTASTYDAYGNYRITLDTTDTGTLGTLRIQFIETATCLPVWLDCMVLPAMVYNSLIANSDVLQVDVTQLLGTAWLTPGTAGTPDVNVKLVSGDATAADNAELFFDGTGYAGTNNVIPTVTNLQQIAGSATAATNLSAAYAAFETGTAQAGGASTITLRAGASATNDYYNDQAVFILSGTGAGQTNRITDYDGGTKVATVGTAWVTQPDNTSVYLVLGRIG